MKICVYRTLLAVISLLLATCGPRPEGKDRALRIAVSIRPQLWLVEQIAGKRADAFSVVPPGTSAATYQPSDAKVSRVMRADLFFRIGVPFENGRWFQALSSGGGELKIVDLRQGINLREMDRHRRRSLAKSVGGEAVDREGSNGSDPIVAKDPHIWLSPGLLKRQAKTVATALAELNPSRAEMYRANLRRVRARLDALDSDIREQLAEWQGRPFFVFHPAWGYFADEYGLEQVAIELEGKEPTDRELTLLQKRAREWGVAMIFVQPQISRRAAEAVAKVIDGRVVALDPLARAIPENLGEAAKRIRQSYEQRNNG